MAYRYRSMKVDGRTVMVHRHVMAQALGRPLRRDEHVHHRNGDPHDNRPENLEILDPHAHARLHKQRHPYTKRCGWCGAEFTPAPTKRQRAKGCSQECATQIGWRTRRLNATSPDREVA